MEDQTENVNCTREKSYIDTEMQNEQPIRIANNSAIELSNDSDNENASLKTRELVYDDSNRAFSFETEQLALKNNSDFKNILQAIVMLEAQKAKAENDFCKLKMLKEEALANPLHFIERLGRKENLHLPKRQKIHPVPIIDWAKYSISGNPAEFSHRQLLRIAAQTAQNFSQDFKKAHFQRGSNEIGRKWTKEEMNKLKDLLLSITIYPEINRWEKIAEHFSCRTPSEIIAQAQKLGYSSDNVKILDPKNNFTSKQSTTSFESDHNLKFQYDVDEDSLEDKDYEDINPDLHNTAEFCELMLLKKVLKKKLRTTSGLPQHHGYRCCRCKNEPIIGVRWHCTECKPPLSVDFCEECVECVYEVGHHTSSHKLEEIYHTGFMDKDYMHFLGNDYNYLDPNYMPAS